ncbi:MAG: adenylate/guanylate cyclase domain-containing protein [Verrucomicrobiota bacterium]|nr:adenylate/guanylate cyclase domain-containing protein [Verrucomicrobiota bacterium]
MASDVKKEIVPEIGHVLFIDIVGYTKLLIHEQIEHLEQLRDITRATEPFLAAQGEGKLLRLPTGDGGALVFRTGPEAPVLCAIEIARALKKHPDLRVRMGVHSGPVRGVTDLSEQGNIAGAGINIAQRVMDCGDAGHILLSKHVADDLEQYGQWRPLLHDLGTCEVKHGVTLQLFNLYSDEIGNAQRPKKLPGGEAREEKVEPARAISRKSIAVLPFENLSEDKANAYFADGIQEEILTRLSRISDLKVISRTSTQRFKNTGEQIPEIAKLLGVATVLEGSVRKAGDNVRVHVQLIDAENDTHLWAERYDRRLDDIFAVETDIATHIADALQAELSGAERRAIGSRPTKSTEAHELYLKGRYHWRNFYAPGYERVREYFEQAIALDASYAPAYNGLSLYYSFAASNALFSPNESWPLAEEAVRKSLSLDDTLPEAYNALAAVELYYKRDWPAAERAFLRGMQLDPNFGDLPAHYGLCLSYFGRNKEALAQMERALQLDPFFPGINLHLGVVFFFSRDYDRAAAQFAKTLELYPGYAAVHEYFGEVCAKKEMPSEAITQWCAALTLNGRAEDAGVLEQLFATAGFDAAVRALAQRQLEALDARRARGDYVPAAHYLFAQVRRGNIEEAFACLPEVVEERDWFALQLRVNPMLDRLRGDPRFEKIVA